MTITINPFWLGVVTTLTAQIIVFALWLVIGFIRVNKNAQNTKE